MRPMISVLALTLTAAGLTAATAAAEMTIVGTIVIGDMNFDGSEGLVGFIEENGYECPHLTSMVLGGDNGGTRVCCDDACYVIEGGAEPTITPE